MNLSETIASSIRAERPERVDDGLLHVGDVANGCPRQVWHRLTSGAHVSFDDPTIFKFEYGHAWEQIVRQALFDAGVIPNMDPPEIIEMTHPSGTKLVGHPDIVAEAELIEVKTTMLFRSGYNPPAHPDKDTLRMKSPQYIIQGALYAEALGKETFTIHVSDRGTGLVADYAFVTAEETPQAHERWDEMQSVYADEEAPAAPPQWTRNAKGVSYLCRSCPVTTCLSNPAYKAKETVAS